MKKEWTGFLVGPDEFEPKHPQLEAPRVGPDPQALRNPRPDRREGFSVYLFTDPVGLPVFVPRAIGQVGDVLVQVNAPVDVTSDALLGQVGETEFYRSTATPSGVSATASTSSVEAITNTGVAEGLEATASVGDVTITSNTGTPSGIESTGSVGTASVVPSIEASATGVSATGSPGSATFTGSLSVSIDAGELDIAGATADGDIQVTVS